MACEALLDSRDLTWNIQLKRDEACCKFTAEFTSERVCIIGQLLNECNRSIMAQNTIVTNRELNKSKTRNQAVARIADRTASQDLWLT